MGREKGELGVTNVLRNAEAGNGEASNEVPFELEETVLSSPLEYREDPFNKQPRLLPSGLVFEVAERLIVEECLRHHRSQLLPSVLPRRHPNLWGRRLALPPRLPHGLLLCRCLVVHDPSTHLLECVHETGKKKEESKCDLILFGGRGGGSDEYL